MENIIKPYVEGGILSAQKAIDSLEIGGTNLFSYENSSSGASTWTTATKVVIDDKKAIQCEAMKVDSSLDYYVMMRLDTPEKEETGEKYPYTMTLKVKANVPNVKLKGAVKVTHDTYTDTAIIISPETVITDSWQTFSVTFSFSESASNCCILLRLAMNENNEPVTVYYADIKLERGNKPTDWSPAPEDLRYTLPIANTDTLGGVKVDGTTITAASDGTISAVGGGSSDFTLPVASAETLGGIKSGGDIAVSEIGGVTVNSVNGKTVGKDVPENAVFTDTVYTLPKATISVLGGVKPDGTTITINSDGIISANVEDSSKEQWIQILDASYNNLSSLRPILASSLALINYKWLTVEAYTAGINNGKSVNGTTIHNAGPLVAFFNISSPVFVWGCNYYLATINDLPIHIRFINDYRTIHISSYASGIYFIRLVLKALPK